MRKKRGGLKSHKPPEKLHISGVLPFMRTGWIWEGFDLDGDGSETKSSSCFHKSSKTKARRVNVPRKNQHANNPQTILTT